MTGQEGRDAGDIKPELGRVCPARRGQSEQQSKDGNQQKAVSVNTAASVSSEVPNPLVGRGEKKKKGSKVALKESCRETNYSAAPPFREML